MALSLRLNLRPSQSLVMTRKLQQAIRLLQLSNLGLLEFVEEPLQNNPLLEREDTGEYKFKTEPSQDRYATAKSSNP